MNSTPELSHAQSTIMATLLSDRHRQMHMSTATKGCDPWQALQLKVVQAPQPGSVTTGEHYTQSEHECHK